MKKAILMLLAIGGFATAQAQQQAPNPGSILIYGDLGFSTSTDRAGFKHLNWNASPGVGYQFNDNMTVGLNVSWGQNAITDTSAAAVTVTDNLYRAGAFFRYTYPLSNIFFAYGQFDAAYIGNYTTSGSLPAWNKATGFEVGITPAVGVHVGKGFALNFGIGGITYRTMSESTWPSTESGFRFTVGQQFNFGISKNIGVRSARSERQPLDETRNLNIDED
jgi:hypothetical protein